MRRDVPTEEQESDMVEYDTSQFVFTLTLLAVLLFGFGFTMGATHEHIFGLFHGPSNAMAPQENGSHQESLIEEDLEVMRKLGIPPDICLFVQPPDWCH